MPLMLSRHVSAPGTRQRRKLDRGEPLGDDGYRRLRVFRRLRALVAPAVRIDADLLAALAAEQIVDRLSACLADDVPERLLDGALRAVQVERAAPLTKVIVDRLQKVLDVERAAAHAGLAQLRDLADDSAVPSSQRI